MRVIVTDVEKDGEDVEIVQKDLGVPISLVLKMGHGQDITILTEIDADGKEVLFILSQKGVPIQAEQRFTNVVVVGAL